MSVDPTPHEQLARFFKGLSDAASESNVDADDDEDLDLDEAVQRGLALVKRLQAQAKLEHEQQYRRSIQSQVEKQVAQFLERFAGSAKEALKSLYVAEDAPAYQFRNLTAIEEEDAQEMLREALLLRLSQSQPGEERSTE